MLYAVALKKGLKRSYKELKLYHAMAPTTGTSCLKRSYKELKLLIRCKR